MCARLPRIYFAKCLSQCLPRNVPKPANCFQHGSLSVCELQLNATCHRHHQTGSLPVNATTRLDLYQSTPPPDWISTSQRHHQTGSLPVNATTRLDLYQSTPPPDWISTSQRHHQSGSLPVNANTRLDLYQSTPPPDWISTSQRHHQTGSLPVNATTRLDLYHPVSDCFTTRLKTSLPPGLRHHHTA